MSRPDYPRGCGPMPVEVIRGIRQEQAAYDADPERYDRQEREQEEEYQREQQELAEMQQEQ